MRKVRTDAIENTTLNSVQKFLKLVSVSKQIECCSRQIAVSYQTSGKKCKHNLFSLICFCINDLINFVQFKLEHSVTGWVIINSSILN